MHPWLNGKILTKKAYSPTKIMASADGCSTDLLMACLKSAIGQIAWNSGAASGDSGDAPRRRTVVMKNVPVAKIRAIGVAASSDCNVRTGCPTGPVMQPMMPPGWCA